LPESITLAALQWLSDVDGGLAELESSATSLSDHDQAVLREAIGDVRVVISFARQAYSSEAPPTERPASKWVPIARPSPALAPIVAATDEVLKQTPWELIEHAKATLEERHQRAFLLVTGDVLGSIFINLFRAVWDEYPQYAPADWEHAAP
jgi:hypothetical protein